MPAAYRLEWVLIALTTAEWALAVAFASAFLALGGLIWNLTLYWLSGSRINVELKPGALSHTVLIEGSENGLPKRRQLRSVPEFEWKHWIDVAVVTISNVGRTATSVSKIGLDFGARPRWQPWARFTMTSIPIALYQGIDKTENVRLKPGESAVVIIDCWPLIQYARKGEEAVPVRGTARPAGRRAKRSPRRKRWVVDSSRDGIWPIIDEGEADLGLYRLVWRAVSREDVTAVSAAWTGVKGAIDYGDESISLVERLKKPLSETLGEFQATITAFQIADHLQRISGSGATRTSESEEE